MLCMICKNNVPDEAVSCPVCGAMPWQMPDSFLNPEQHQVWLETIYTPQRERWEKVLQLQAEVRALQEENQVLQDKIKEKEGKTETDKDVRRLRAELSCLLNEVLSQKTEEKNAAEKHVKRLRAELSCLLNEVLSLKTAEL